MVSLLITLMNYKMQFLRSISRRSQLLLDEYAESYSVDADSQTKKKQEEKIK